MLQSNKFDFSTFHQNVCEKVLYEQIKKFRSSRSQVLKFTGKHLQWCFVGSKVVDLNATL